MWFFWPDTKGMPLEEIAALFGDQDEVAIYQREIFFDHEHNALIDLHDGTTEKPDALQVENTAASPPAQNTTESLPAEKAV